MRFVMRACRSMVFGLATLGLAAAPAFAQWTRVTDIPAIPLFSIFTKGDTIVAGADTAVYLSTNGGVTWSRTAKPVGAVSSIQAVRMRDGRLFAGTLGQGVQVSDDLGRTWRTFNEGLVGGFLDSQLDVVDLSVRGTVLLAATAGAGVYARDLSGGGVWQHFGEVFEPEQASNMNGLALGGTRLLASAGSNGEVFIRDPADAEWTISHLDNIGIHAGLQPMTAVFTGTACVAGTNIGIFRSLTGKEPWTRFDAGIGPLFWTTLANEGQHVFTALDISVGAVTETSDDDGATWQFEEFFPDVFIKALAVSGNTLFAAREDGLWRRPTGIAGVPGLPPVGLRFALAGPQPFGDETRLRFDLPQAGRVTIEIFDVLGRKVSDELDGWWSSGPHEVALQARQLSPGVYDARLTAGGARENLMLVHIR